MVRGAVSDCLPNVGCLSGTSPRNMEVHARRNQ